MMMTSIVLIEKNPFFRQMVELTLKREGFQVFSYSSLQEGFPFVEDIVPAVILFDLETIDGEEWASHFFRELEKNPQTQAILLIALGQENPQSQKTLESLNSLRPIALWTKPLSPRFLVEKVRQITGR